MLFCAPQKCRPAGATPDFSTSASSVMRLSGPCSSLGERRRQRLSQRNSGREQDIKTLKLPTLILWGGKDRLIPPAYARRFVADISGAKLVTFEQLGHVPQEGDPAATLAAVQAFLR
jgi:pimeloyl-ACP methyl ester carboxylesterase